MQAKNLPISNFNYHFRLSPRFLANMVAHVRLPNHHPATIGGLGDGIGHRAGLSEVKGDSD